MPSNAFTLLQNNVTCNFITTLVKFLTKSDLKLQSYVKNIFFCYVPKHYLGILAENSYFSMKYFLHLYTSTLYIVKAGKNYESRYGR